MCIYNLVYLHFKENWRAAFHDTQTNSLRFIISGISKSLIRVQVRKLMERTTLLKFFSCALLDENDFSMNHAIIHIRKAAIPLPSMDASYRPYHRVPA